MTPRKSKDTERSKPKLEAGMRIVDFSDYYWSKDELTRFARTLGLQTRGSKPELSARIARALRGAPDTTGPRPHQPRGPRDSDKRLTRNTPVVHYKSDDRTREFFKRVIGPAFHFTYQLNQYRLRHPGLTYGDLVDEWIAEKDRRHCDGYRAPIAEQGKYNRFIRDFYADEANQDKSLSSAAAAWNAIKNRRGEPRYGLRRHS
ncbi:MAG TPA: DUF6434 domain-containing protein [Gemmatimonadaceae bacterium]|nr:DUF6434 domain-containing protein [Gemmatimonadaceae bacterium]